jgi:hypothetical protein
MVRRDAFLPLPDDESNADVDARRFPDVVVSNRPFAELVSRL